jgi:hypothetical protein
MARTNIHFNENRQKLIEIATDLFGERHRAPSGSEDERP